MNDFMTTTMRDERLLTPHEAEAERARDILDAADDAAEQAASDAVFREDPSSPDGIAGLISGIEDGDDLFRFAGIVATIVRDASLPLPSDKAHPALLACRELRDFLLEHAKDECRAAIDARREEAKLCVLAARKGVEV